MIDLEDLGPALRLLRLRHGSRQHDLAHRAGITKAMLSGYERGARLPSLRSLAAVLDAQGVGFDKLHRAMECAKRRRSARRPSGRHEPPQGSRS